MHTCLCGCCEHSDTIDETGNGGHEMGSDIGELRVLAHRGHVEGIWEHCLSSVGRWRDCENRDPVCMSLSRALCRVGRSLLNKKPLQLRTRASKTPAGSSYRFSKVSPTSILLIRRNFCAIEEMSFQFKVDAFGSIAIDHKTLPNDEIVFGKHLEQCLREWREAGRKGVFLKIPIEKSFLIPVATELGFAFHHARPEYLMLTKWLLSTPNKLPFGATHTVGVGGFVVNDKKQILVIQEKSGPVQKIWKLPGGRVDLGEEVEDGAVREVFEETGIKTEFKSMVCFRSAHGGAFGNSDFYFVCLLKPITSEIKKQEDEIADAQWMNLDDFLKLPYYKGLYQEVMQFGAQALEGNYSGLVSTELPIIFRAGNAKLYHIPKPKL
eukprot:TRINITY_DN2162_c0_g1_i2.p1 TRINITY_DN2162_c0_g1~~TRINITY_DN2162_c0_g1_i2.p1  ORF type:complete len:380 (-),score=48.66 TRINITY_DN2162_c0_g1_i2:116-1255(-)